MIYELSSVQHNKTFETKSCYFSQRGVGKIIESNCKLETIRLPTT